MREKIDGHIYDTDTAQEIDWRQDGPDDCGWMNMYRLYRTRRGLWFLHHETWREHDYGRTRSKHIHPISEQEAKKEQEDMKAYWEHEERLNKSHTA